MVYQIQGIKKGVTLIRDSYDEAIYLIEGSQKALLIDTGMDKEDLSSIIQSLTDKTIDVVLTHGHIDHIGRTGDFDHVLMNLKDKDVYQKHTHMSQGHFRCEDLHFKDVSQIKPLPPIISLGDKEIQVIPLAGHTLGSVIFIDHQDHFAYTGDAIGSGQDVWMQLEECLPMSEYKKSLQDALTLLKKQGVDDRYLFFGGHYEQYTTDNHLLLPLMEDMIKLCQNILEGHCDLIKSDAMCLQQAYTCAYQKASMVICKGKIK